MNTLHIHTIALLAAFPLLTAQADEVTLTPIMDAAVSEASPDQNYGTSNLVVGKSSGQAWESFLRFDLSGIPVNAEITGAELRLRAANFGSGGTLRVSMPDSGWAEADVKWSNRPSATTLADIALTVEDPNNAHLTLTAPVLSHLQDVVSSVTPDRGLKLSFPTATAEQFLAPLSRESGNPPQLVIAYTPGPELPDFIANLTTLDDRLRAELFKAPEEAPTPFELVWNTKPGVRYRLWESPDLDDWSVVDGYPVEADALGAVHEVPLTPPARFYKVEALDEQPPGITSRFPDDSDFGIRRFAGGVGNELEIQLSDVTGIDPESVALTLSGHGTFTNGGVGLALDDSGLLTLDLGGDTALGAYGATVNASLTVADPLGNSATYDWSFELEKEVILAEGLFTFGSPDAQRAGQRVQPIPTRMLAERLGGGGPIRANDSEWTLESVAEDHLVIAYTGASAPVFTVDQYLTNMTPAKVNEIFYRKVTAVSDNTTTKKLTLGTADVPAWEVMVDGSMALNSDDIAFELDSEGNIIRAYAMRALSASAKLELRPLEVNWSGKSIMGLFTLFGETKASFGLPIASKDPLGNDWDAKLNLKQAKLRLSPTISISADMGLLAGLRKFHSETRVDVDAVLEPEFEFLAASIEYAMKAEDKTGEPLLKHPIVIPLELLPCG